MAARRIATGRALPGYATIWDCTCLYRFSQVIPEKGREGCLHPAWCLPTPTYPRTAALVALDLTTLDHANYMWKHSAVGSTTVILLVVDNLFGAGWEKEEGGRKKKKRLSAAPT